MSGTFARTATIIPMKGDIVIQPQAGNTNRTRDSSLLRHGRRAPGFPGESMPYRMQIEAHCDAFDASVDPTTRNEIVHRVENNLRGNGIRFLRYETALSAYVLVTDLETIWRVIFSAFLDRTKKVASALSSILNDRLESGIGGQHHDALRRGLVHQQPAASPAPAVATATSLNDVIAKRRRLDHQQRFERVARREVIVDLTDDPQDEQQGAAGVPNNSTGGEAAAASLPHDSLMDRMTKHHQMQQQQEKYRGSRDGGTMAVRARLVETFEEKKRMLEAADMHRKREAAIKAISQHRNETERQQVENLRRYKGEVHQLSGQATGQQQNADARASSLNAAGMLDTAVSLNQSHAAGSTLNHPASAINQYSAAAPAASMRHQQQPWNFSSQFAAGLSMPLGAATPGLGHSAGHSAEHSAGLAATRRLTGVRQQQNAGIQQQYFNDSTSGTAHLPASHANMYPQHFFKSLKINDLPSKSSHEMSGWHFFPMKLEKDLKNLAWLNEWRIVVTPMSGNLDRSFTVDPPNALPAATGR